MSKHLQSRPLCTGLILFGCALLASTALGQSRLPMNVVTAADASGSRTQIDTFTTQAVKAIKSTDPATQKTGRDAIISQIAAAGATPSFLSEFAGSLNDQMLAAKLPSDPELRVRLNGAIAVARVAMVVGSAGGNTAKLEPVTEAFIKDKSAPICLWGIKASGAILPSMLTGAQQPKSLATAVVDATRDHSDDGMIAEEAYRSLTLSGPGGNKAMSSPLLKGFVQYVLTLLDTRVGLYQVAVPPSPVADTDGTNFLVVGVVWNSMDAPQQSKSVKLMMDLIENANKQLGSVTDKAELATVIRRTGKALQVAGQLLNNREVTDKAQAVGAIGDDPDLTDLQMKIDALKAAVQALNLPSSTSVAAP